MNGIIKKLLGATTLALALGVAGCEKDKDVPEPTYEIVAPPKVVEYTPPVIEEEVDCDWEAGTILEIGTHETLSPEKHYSCAIKQGGNVLMLYNNYTNPMCEELYPLAEYAVAFNPELLKVAKVERPEQPTLFFNHGIFAEPTYKFYRTRHNDTSEREDLRMEGGIDSDKFKFGLEMLINDWEYRVTYPEDYDSYYELLEGSGETLVMAKFGAFWCGWCNRFDPMVEKASVMYSDQMEEYDEDQVKVLNIDLTVADLERLTADYGIGGIPHTMFFHQGMRDPRFDILGYVEYDMLEMQINNAIEYFYGEETTNVKSSQTYFIDRPDSTCTWSR